MRQIPEVGDTVTITEFAFMNPSGGTGLSDWAHDPRFTGKARVAITKTWHDYETGQRYIGTAASPDLVAYLKANAKADDQRVFFSQFDLPTVQS